MVDAVLADYDPQITPLCQLTARGLTAGTWGGGGYIFGVLITTRPYTVYYISFGKPQLLANQNNNLGHNDTGRRRQVAY
jgi:hypothetical protein